MRHRRQVVKRLLSARRRAEQLQLVYAYLGLHKESWASSILLKYGTTRLLLLFSKSLSSMHLPSATSIKHIASASFVLFLPYFRRGHGWQCATLPSGCSCLIKERRSLWPSDRVSLHIRNNAVYILQQGANTERRSDWTLLKEPHECKQTKQCRLDPLNEGSCLI